MAILTNTGRAELLRSLSVQPIFMGWGRGDGQWQTSPAESPDATGLTSPVGYRKATEVSFCTPDLNGEISVSSGQFAKTEAPTRHLYVQFRYDFNDAIGETIREVGVFMNTDVAEGLPEGQMYFDAPQVTDPGQLLLLENYRPLFRDEGVREHFDFVVTL